MALGLLALLLLLLLAQASRLIRVQARALGFPSGFPGRKGEGRLEVELFAPLPVLYRLRTHPSAPLGLEPQEALGLAWGRLRLNLPLPYGYRRRGEHPLGLSLRLESLFGTGARTLDLEAGRALVFPPLRPLTPHRNTPSFFLEGTVRPTGLPDPLETRGLRPYRPGDPLRLLAPKASLRLGIPVVREVERTLLGSLFVHLDTQGLHPAYLDHAASLAAWLLLQAEKRGERFGLSASEVLPPGRGRAHLRRALALLARLEPTPIPALPPLPPPGSTYILLSQCAETVLLRALLEGMARARKGVLILLPEGYFLFPGEKGRPAFGKTPGLERVLALKDHLAAHRVELRVVRGHQTPLL
ncbi:DUF58 domain-containing protein [Thermus sp.]|uniref:DUF58 domain-containing protein n=1 Tax=Thermus sp. TaxID=275 RepID=UPI003317959C